MKHLLFFFLFSGSLDSFSQVFDLRDTAYYQLITGVVALADPPKPDTLRAIVLVTLSPNGIAHARMGYVVIQEGRKPVYLTCDKKPLKLPQVGWGYELVEAKEGRR